MKSIIYNYTKKDVEKEIKRLKLSANNTTMNELKCSDNKLMNFIKLIGVIEYLEEEHKKLFY